MKSFDLAEPATLGEAVALLDSQDRSVRAIAGGTALMLMMKTRLFQPTRLVSLRRLHGDLRGIRVNEGGGLRIGAMTSLAELEHSPLLASTYSPDARRKDLGPQQPWSTLDQCFRPFRWLLSDFPREGRADHGSGRTQPAIWRSLLVRKIYRAFSR